MILVIGNGGGGRATLGGEINHAQNVILYGISIRIKLMPNK